MSAYIVENIHINAILTWALDNGVNYYWGDTRRPITPHNVEEVGRILMDENVRSVAHRYAGQRFPDCGSNYSFKRLPFPLTAAEVIKACHCLSYQSCECDNHDKTVAFHILGAIVAAASSKVIGYEAAPWDISAQSASRLQHAGSVRLSSVPRMGSRLRGGK